jgi:mRNA interferase MazF
MSRGTVALRGEVWWVRLDPTIGSEIAKTRPCLVLSSNIVNERRKTVVVVPLSSSPHSSPPLLVPVQCGGRNAVAVVDQIRAVSKERLDRRMATLSVEHLEAVEQALREVLELG